MERIALPGLGAEVEILTDPWGVPHIYAQNEGDAFFAQGFVQARDRLWQIDLKRRRGLGRLAEAYGPDFARFDHAARLFLHRGDAAAAWVPFGPRIAALAAAYVRGINAYIGLTRDDPALLPPEFGALGCLPEFWEVDDLVRIRAGNNSGNVAGELRRALLARDGALHLDHLAQPLEPPWETSVPDGLDPAALEADDLALYELMKAPLPWHGTVSRADRDPDATDGSNAWVIAPSRSATGRPILANDPHLAIGQPSVRHIAQLSWPGFSLTGGAVPGMPGIANGHNAHIAFGRTNFSLDQEDLYVLETDAAGDAYRHGGQWHPFTRVTETIPVRGGEAVGVVLEYAHFGPVLARRAAQRRAVVLRATWLAPGAAGLVAQIPYNLATDWRSFNEALRTATFPTNYFYADTFGNIGWRPAGHAPVRPHHDGLLPVPGDGRYDWAGLHRLEDLPSAFNPDAGWIGNGNQMPLPPGFPYAERRLSFEWTASDRYDRLAEVLAGSPRAGLADSVALQHDIVSRRALLMIGLLGDVADDPVVARLRASIVARLRAWDGRLAVDSAEAAVFAFWWAELDRALLAELVPAGLHRRIGTIHPTVRRDILQRPEAWLGADGAARRTRLLADTLAQAVRRLAERLGPDPAGWRWGDLHGVTLRHSAAPALGPALAAQTTIAGGRSGGDAGTVMARWYQAPAAADVTGGASYSMVLDVGEWDNSVALNLPGQSGNPHSPHFRDLYAPWIEGRPFPLLFSRARVEAVARERLMLVPTPCEDTAGH